MFNNTLSFVILKINIFLHLYNKVILASLEMSTSTIERK
jgi:hypothetical protein